MPREIDPRAFANDTAERAAARLLEHCKGDGRLAEQLSWDLVKGRRECGDKVGVDFFANTARVIADGAEVPKIERTTPLVRAFDANGKPANASLALVE